MPISRRLITLFLVFLLSHPGFTQEKSIPKKFLADASQVVRGAKYVLTSPLRWQKKDWATFGAVAAGTVALSLLDEPADNYLRRHSSRTADKFREFGNEYGEPRTVIILTGGLYAVGLVAGSEWLRETCVILSASMLASGIIQSTTKYAAGRARPRLGLGHAEFDPFRTEELYYSFFSGHTMVAMTTSHVFAKRIHHMPAKIVLYSLGAIGSFARMYNRDHWSTDVALGNALAIASVNSVSKWLVSKKEGKERRGAQWQITPRGRGVSLMAHW